jgi:predicted acylesterase/phospholipase RssA
MTIKHLVVSGGSWKGLYVIGTIDKLLEETYFDMKDVETCWVTSVGSLIVILLCLNIEWKVIIEYFINVPVKILDNIKLDNYINAINKSGVLNETLLIDLLKSLFKSKNLDITKITLKEFNNFCGKEINFFATKYITLETTIFNHKTHPQLRLLDALYASCCFPFAFQPININGYIYIDGGINVHYPSSYCLKEKKNEEILGIYVKTTDPIDKDINNILEFGCNLIYKIIFDKQMKNLDVLKNQVIITSKSIGFEGIKKLIKDKEERKKTIDGGRDFAYLFLKYSNH